MKNQPIRALYLLLLTAACAVSSVAGAGEPSAADKEVAREAYGEAMSREEAKDYGAALVKYQKAHAIMNVPPTGLAVARMHEQLGQLVEARDAAIAVALIAVGSNESEAFTQARTDARTMAERLKERIPTLRVSVQGLPADFPFQLLVDGYAVASATARDSRPVNPGAHKIVVRAEGYREASAQVVVVDKEKKEVSLQLTVDPTVGVKKPVQPVPVPAREAEASSSNWLGWSVVGVGAAGMGVGLFSWLKMRSSQDTVDSHCKADSRVCDSTGFDAAQDGKTWTTVNTVSMIVGAVGLGTGVYLLLSDSGTSSKSTTAVGASPSLAGGSLFLHQTF